MAYTCEICGRHITGVCGRESVDLDKSVLKPLLGSLWKVEVNEVWRNRYTYPVVCPACKLQEGIYTIILDIRRLLDGQSTKRGIKHDRTAKPRNIA